MDARCLMLDAPRTSGRLGGVGRVPTENRLPFGYQLGGEMVQLPIPIHRTNRSHEMKPFLFLCHGFVLPAQKQPLNGVPAIKIPNSSVYRHGLSLARRKDRVLKSGRGRQLQNGKFPINNYAKTLTRSSPIPSFILPPPSEPYLLFSPISFWSTTHSLYCYFPQHHCQPMLLSFRCSPSLRSN